MPLKRFKEVDLSGLTPEEIESRKVLAQNLQRLMSKRPKLNSNPKISKKADIGIATLSRVTRMDGGATLDTITRLATVFGLQPWQMLVPGLDPEHPQILRSLSAAEEAMYAKMREVVEEEVKARDSRPGHL